MGRGAGGGGKQHDERNSHGRNGGALHPRVYGTTPGQLGTMKEGIMRIEKGDNMREIPVEVWTSCYNDSWKGYITDESFAH